jgi:hypothetical protein
MATTRQVNLTPQQMQAALQSIASSGGPASASAQQLLASLNANPNLANDPGFVQLVNQAATADNESRNPTTNPTTRGKALQGLQSGAQQVTTNQAAVRSQMDQENLIKQIIGGAQQGQDFQNYVTLPSLAAQKQAGQTATLADMVAYNNQSQARDRAVAQNNSLVNEQRNKAGAYNYLNQDLYTNYANQQNALNAQDQGTLSKYMSETDPLMTQLQARGSSAADIANQQAALSRATGIADGSLNYQAALASSNAQDVARQQGSYNTLEGVGGGSLDYTAAQYQSNPYDVQRQETAYNDFRGIGNGSLDYQSQAARANADPQDLANQRKALSDIQADVAGGNKEQLEALNLIKGRTGVTATAEERFLAEQARRSFESQDRSNREAVLQDLSMRGLRSGGAEIASALANQERLGQDRTLAELGLQANAMQRAQAYTGMQADQSNAMRGSAQNALGLQGNLSTAMRNASFDEAYKRGVGADTASANNQSTRLSGYQYAGQQSNAIRQANDAVGIANTGWQNDAYANNQRTRLSGYQSAAEVATEMRNASDRMNISNAGFQNDAYANNQRTMMQGAQLQGEQSNALREANDAMSRFQDAYAQAEATRIGGLAKDRSDTAMATTAQIGGRNDLAYDKGASSLDTQYGRDKDSISLASGANKDQYTMDSDVNNALSQMGANGVSRATGLTGSAIAAGAAGGASQQAIINALGLQMDANSAEAAKKLIRGW